jgi:hypothetical protein
MIPDDEFTRRRKSRSVVTALILGAFAVLFFFMTIAKIHG